LKPEKLRYIPVIIPDPKPPNPALSYAPRQTTKPYFSEPEKIAIWLYRDNFV
jgi:hypothetical protein